MKKFLPESDKPLHILVVEDPEDPDEGYELFHPQGCAVRWSTHAGVEYECNVATQLSEAGFYGMFHRDETLDRGVWVISTYVDKIVGPDWTEWDAGWVVEPLFPFDAKTFTHYHGPDCDKWGIYSEGNCTCK